MNQHQVKINSTFNAPVEKIFELLNDHDTFGKITEANISRIVESKDPENINGVGSVRKITIGFSFEETIVKSEKNKLIDYTITKGMHFFSSHYGSMVFSSLNDKQSELNYTISIGIKFPILSKMIIDIIGRSLRKKLIKLNKNLTENPNYKP